MTRKDFELIAGVIRDYRNDAPEDLRERADLIANEFAKRFARELAGTNKRFDKGSFVEATK